ncbi:REM2- and Rab-like small GTPase 1 [Armadillidium nasatum]|uniref:Ciliogenesis and planar polarity effector 2 n=1 Tax=Armadillidium nasatum TaxID=96803 RepID=A0A5N5SM82_9CRUS|nr:REM2- and Rab-like small GTPase 1 [Armadillidium nasatum]
MAAQQKVDNLKAFQQKLFITGTKKRKQFGLLERPSVPPSVPQVSFKLYVCGSSGSGKSYFVQRLAGTEGKSRNAETLGIEVSHVYWPMKIGNRVMLFRLELWDAGDASSKRFSHIKPACGEAIDGMIICFSVTSLEQWNEVPQLVSNASQSSEKAAVMVLASRLDKPTEMVVSENEIRTFEANHDVPVLRLPPVSNDPMTIAPILNFICKQLWHRDQKLLSVSKEKG